MRPEHHKIAKFYNSGATAITACFKEVEFTFKQVGFHPGFVIEVPEWDLNVSLIDDISIPENLAPNTTVHVG